MHGCSVLIFVSLCALTRALGNNNRQNLYEVGLYYTDNSGRYIHDDSGRYIPDYSGLYNPDYSGLYAHDNSGDYMPEKYEGFRKSRPRFNFSTRTAKQTSLFEVRKNSENINKPVTSRSLDSDDVEIEHRPESEGNFEHLNPSGRYAHEVRRVIKQVTKKPRYDGHWKIIKQAGGVGKTGYDYLYETENKILAQEKAKVTNPGSNDESIASNGFYQYVGDDDMEYKLTYTADENGFIPTGNHLHPSIVRLLEYHKAQGLKKE